MFIALHTFLQYSQQFYVSQYVNTYAAGKCKWIFMDLYYFQITSMFLTVQYYTEGGFVGGGGWETRVKYPCFNVEVVR
jgi:hypothetical protein